MTTAVKTFLLILAVLILGGLGAWFGWRAYSWPTKTFSNGWKMHIAKSWYLVDISGVPEQSRPLLFAQRTEKETENRITVNDRPYPAKDLNALVSEMKTQLAIESPNAKVLGSGYLLPKTKTLPYVYQQGNGFYTITMMAAKDGRTYYFEARYKEAVKDTFGQEIISSFRSLR